MKKVLFVATVATHIKGFHEPYLNLLKYEGYKTYVVSKNNLKENEVIKFCDRFVDISIERNPFKFGNIKAIIQLKHIIDKEKFDIIHCHTPMGSVVARIAAKQARKKYNSRVIYTAHGFHFFKGAPLKNWLLYYPVEWYLAKYTDTLITINKEDYNFAKKRLYKRCHDIKYVPGIGIDTKKFDVKMNNKQKEKYRESLGLKSDAFILTCVARLDSNKNQGFLIDVVKSLVKENNNIHLLLVGPDELNGYYQKMVSEKRINNNVHFLGRRNDIPEILAITDIVLSASKREGLPVNVMESLAAGKPVVALDCRGMRDLITNGKNGFVIKKNDIKSFIDKIIVLFSDKELCNKIKENNLNCIKKFDITKVLNKFKSNIYFKQ